MIRRRRTANDAHLWTMHGLFVVVVSIIYSSSRITQMVQAFGAVSAPSVRVMMTPTRFRNGLNQATSDDSSSTGSDTLTPASTAATEPVTTKMIPKGKVLQQTVIIDGPEWKSVQNQLLRLSSTPSQQAPVASNYYTTSSSGIYNIVTGSINGERMVGMQQLLPVPTNPFTSKPFATTNSTDTSSSNGLVVVPLDQDRTMQIYKESIAYIPTDVSELDALWTMIQSFSTVHCARPIVPNIGGGGAMRLFRRRRSKGVGW